MTSLPLRHPDLTPGADGLPDVRRIAVVGSSRLFTEALARLITRAADLDAERCDPARLEHPATRPDVVVLDGDDGRDEVVELTGRLRSAWPEVRLLLIVRSLGPAQRRLAAEVDAAGCLTRDVRADDLIAALRQVCQEGRVRAEVATRPRRTARRSWQDLLAGQLTERELEVVRLLGGGTPADDIARQLAISPHTVRKHIQNSMLKLGVDSRLKVVAFARQAGLLDRPARSARPALAAVPTAGA